MKAPRPQPARPLFDDALEKAADAWTDVGYVALVKTLEALESWLPEPMTLPEASPPPVRPSRAAWRPA